MPGLHWALSLRGERRLWSPAAWPGPGSAARWLGGLGLVSLASCGTREAYP